MLLQQQLGGLIIEPTKSAEGNPNLDYFLALEARRIPFVMLNERYSDLDAPCLKVDDEAGGFRAAEHLAKLGHRRIAASSRRTTSRASSACAASCAACASGSCRSSRII